MKPTVDRCPLCKRRKTRSNPANARYWLLLHMLADKLKPDGKVYTPEIYHEYFKSRFIGVDEIVLPNKKVIHRVKSSAELDVSQFAEYMEQVEQFAAERGVYLDAMETLT